MIDDHKSKMEDGGWNIEQGISSMDDSTLNIEREVGKQQKGTLNGRLEGTLEELRMEGWTWRMEGERLKMEDARSIV